MIIQLTDSDTCENLGLIRIISELNSQTATEITESWHDFHVLAEHNYDSGDIEDFVTWNNENYVTQIERFFVDLVL